MAFCSGFQPHPGARLIGGAWTYPMQGEGPGTASIVGANASHWSPSETALFNPLGSHIQPYFGPDNGVLGGGRGPWVTAEK